MKVIATDNFDRDYVSDRLIADNLTKADAETLAAEKNKGSGPYSDWFFLAVADDRKLHVWEP